MSRSNQNQVKNRAPAPIQISAEQILREAADRQDENVLEPIVKVHDAEEYQSHLSERRKHYEDNIRYRRDDIGNWVKYTRFEEENKELERARSIFERALEVDHRSGELWLRYAEFELRQEFIQHARNVLDRAVQILPRQDFLWYKYVFVEEMVGDIPKARAVFERWMKWKPSDNAWLAYARLETKYGSHERAEQVMRNYVNAYPGITSFCRFAKWAEFEAKRIDLARTVFESAMTELDPDDIKTEGARLFKQFSAFEERQGEYERARVIYQHAISLLNLSHTMSDGTQEENENEDEQEGLSKYEKAKRKELYQAYILFEKKHGNKQGIETVIAQKQRAQYQARLKDNAYDYDGWLEWAALEQEYEAQLPPGEPDHEKQRERVRDTFEQAVAKVPPYPKEKDPWRRYIYVWIYYAVYEELTCGNGTRAAEVYQACLSVIPHTQFTFCKIWVLAAKVYVRLKQLDKARKLLGRAIGTLTKPLPLKTAKIFQEYIALELALGEVDRCRSLYTQFLKVLPHNSKAWTEYATLEQNVGETERCRALYELAIQQESLDMPEQVWKSYIDFEIAEGEHANARSLYEKLLEQTGHVKVWISYAQFEVNTPKDEESGKSGLDRARDIMDKAYGQLKQEGLTEERVLLLDAWRVIEKNNGTPASVAQVEQKLPRRIKRKRMRHDDSGKDIGWEEYFDYQFPDDIDADEATAKSHAQLLEMAAQWKKKQKLMQNNDDSDDDSDDDDDDDDDDSEEE